MVERKRRKIAKKPQTSTKPNPDAWVIESGVDPEIEVPLLSEVKAPVSVVKEETKKVVETKAPEKSGNEKTYPHRISFDMEGSQYKRLKWASFDSGNSMNSILREAVEEWMKTRNY